MARAPRLVNIFIQTLYNICFLAAIGAAALMNEHMARIIGKHGRALDICLRPPDFFHEFRAIFKPNVAGVDGGDEHGRRCLMAATG